MFLVKNTFYVDSISNLYTKQVKNCGFIITDQQNDLYKKELGEFNFTDIDNIHKINFEQEKFILYVEPYNYVKIYNSLIHKIINTYPCLQPYEQFIFDGKSLFVLHEIGIDDHDDFFDLTSLDIMKLHELSFEFLIPILFLTQPRIDRYIKEKLTKFIISWKNHVHKKCYDKVLKYYIISKDLNSAKSLLLLKNHHSDTFIDLLTLCKTIQSNSESFLGEILYEIEFLFTFNNNWASLVDFIINNNVRYVDSKNYKYNEILIQYLFGVISDECATSCSSIEQQTINGSSSS